MTDSGEAGGVFLKWSAAPARPEWAAMNQRTLTRQLRLCESPEGPSPVPPLTLPLSPVDQTRGCGGSVLFRRLKLNRSIQEHSRLSNCFSRYISTASKTQGYKCIVKKKKKKVCPTSGAGPNLARIHFFFVCPPKLPFFLFFFFCPAASNMKVFVF